MNGETTAPPETASTGGNPLNLLTAIQNSGITINGKKLRPYDHKPDVLGHTESLPAVQQNSFQHMNNPTSNLDVNNNVFLPRSFKGIAKDSVSSPSIDKSVPAVTEEGVPNEPRDTSESTTLITEADPFLVPFYARKKPKILRVVSRSIPDRCYDMFLHGANAHCSQTIIDNFLNATLPNVVTVVQYHNQRTMNELLGMHCDADNENTQNPFGFQDRIEVAGYQLDGLKQLIDQVFTLMPDSVLVQNDNVRVLNQDEVEGALSEGKSATLKVCSSVSLIGTAIVHTSLHDLNQCMPFLVAQHPSLVNPENQNLTIPGSMLMGLSSILSNIPLSITLDVGVEVSAYIITHFELPSYKESRVEFHYYRTKTRPFAKVF